MNTTASANSELRHLWDPQLSEREIAFIGLILVQWASLEHEIFVQTLKTFDSGTADPVSLPKEMNNIQFTGVLDLWKERVVDAERGRRATVLKRQHQLILDLKQYRDALVHGMWYWSIDDLGSITSTRVKKRQVISVKFTQGDLSDLATKVAEVNFNVRFPSGPAELAMSQMRAGGYMSRRALAMVLGAPVDEKGFPTANPIPPQE